MASVDLGNGNSLRIDSTEYGVCVMGFVDDRLVIEVTESREGAVSVSMSAPLPTNLTQALRIAEMQAIVLASSQTHFKRKKN